MNIRKDDHGRGHHRRRQGHRREPADRQGPPRPARRRTRSSSRASTSVYKHLKPGQQATSRAAGSPRRCRSTPPTSCSIARPAGRGVRVGHRFTDATARSSATASRAPAQRSVNLGPVKPNRAKDDQPVRPAPARPPRPNRPVIRTPTPARGPDSRGRLSRATNPTRAGLLRRKDRTMARLLDQYNDDDRPGALTEKFGVDQQDGRSPSWRRSSSTWASAAPRRTRRCWTVAVESLTRKSAARSRWSTKAKDSIAGFRLREGNEIGCKVTLRGQVGCTSSSTA